MTAVKKEIYQFFVLNGIYLPMYQLEKLCEEIFRRNKESVLKLLDEFVLRPDLKKYRKADKGAYYGNLQKPEQGVYSVQKVEMCDSDGEVIMRFESQYEAAKHLGKKKGEGNIRRAAKTGRKAYGYKWKFANANSQLD